MASSSNYRAIAIGSLLMKIFDWVLLLLEGDKLSTDELQFGFQALSSTTMCTWTLSTVVEHFNSNGRTVYGAAMDCSKAFDVCSWISLFGDLLEKGVSPIFLRLLLFSYRNQHCEAFFMISSFQWCAPRRCVQSIILQCLCEQVDIASPSAWYCV